jgi:hypothetical protein
MGLTLSLDGHPLTESLDDDTKLVRNETGVDRAGFITTSRWMPFAT